MLRLFRLIFLGDAHRHHYIDKDIKEIQSKSTKSIKKIIFKMILNKMEIIKTIGFSLQQHLKDKLNLMLLMIIYYIKTNGEQHEVRYNKKRF